MTLEGLKCRRVVVDEAVSAGVGVEEFLQPTTARAVRLGRTSANLSGGVASVEFKRRLRPISFSSFASARRPTNGRHQITS
jgi:hypothetical protein